MTSAQCIWMTRHDYTRLHTELAALRSRRSIEVPDDFMDYDANVIAGYSARRARIREIQDLLTNAVVSEDAVGGGIAEPGMVLTIRYDATGETETFLLGRRFGEGADVMVYSTLSPLGHAIAGARPGDQRIYAIPHERPLLVTLVEAVPYNTHVAKSFGPQSGHRDATVTAGHQRPQQQTVAGMKRAPTTSVVPERVTTTAAAS
jgi:transcription elongation GreA/GreB family factor